MDGRLLLRAASPDRLDVDLDLGRVGPRGILVGEGLLPSKAVRIFVGLIMERLAVDVTLYGACLVHHSRDHAGEHKRRYCGDDDQNDCVGSDVGPLVLYSLAADPDGVLGAQSPRLRADYPALVSCRSRDL